MFQMSYKRYTCLKKDGFKLSKSLDFKGPCSVELQLEYKLHKLRGARKHEVSCAKFWSRNFSQPCQSSRRNNFQKKVFLLKPVFWPQGWQQSGLCETPCRPCCCHRRGRLHLECARRWIRPLFLCGDTVLSSKFSHESWILVLHSNNESLDRRVAKWIPEISLRSLENLFPYNCHIANLEPFCDCAARKSFWRNHITKPQLEELWPQQVQIPINATRQQHPWSNPPSADTDQKSSSRVPTFRLCLKVVPWAKPKCSTLRNLFGFSVHSPFVRAEHLMVIH